MGRRDSHINEHRSVVYVSQVLIAQKTWRASRNIFICMRDMSERRQAEEALRYCSKVARNLSPAGMAEVATGVLHNVGNVLNSFNVSAGVVVEKLRRSKVSKLGKAAALLTARNGDLGDYLTHDPSGQKLPSYLTNLSQYLIEENTQLLAEVDLLARNIEHIKEVVTVPELRRG